MTSGGPAPPCTVMTSGIWLDLCNPARSEWGEQNAEYSCYLKTSLSAHAPLHLELPVAVSTHLNPHPSSTRTLALPPKTPRDLKACEELFAFGCPKFLSPVVPNYDDEDAIGNFSMVCCVVFGLVK